MKKELKIKPTRISMVATSAGMCFLYLIFVLDSFFVRRNYAISTYITWFLVCMGGAFLCLYWMCHSYVLNTDGIRQRWLFYTVYTPWEAFTEVSIEPLYAATDKSRYVVCFNRGISRINQNTTAGNHPIRFIVFEILDHEPTKRDLWRAEYPLVNREKILKLLDESNVSVIHYTKRLD